MLAYFHVLRSGVLLRCRRFKDAAAGTSFCRWSLGFNQSRLHLCLAHKICSTSHYIPSCLAAFLPCYFPLRLSVPGRAGILEGDSLSTFCPSGAIVSAPKWRTVSRSIAQAELPLIAL